MEFPQSKFARALRTYPAPTPTRPREESRSHPQSMKNTMNVRIDGHVVHADGHVEYTLVTKDGTSQMRSQHRYSEFLSLAKSLPGPYLAATTHIPGKRLNNGTAVIEERIKGAQFILVATVTKEPPR